MNGNKKRGDVKTPMFVGAVVFFTHTNGRPFDSLNQYEFFNVEFQKSSSTFFSFSAFF
jgi:hypothetical protein